MSPASQGALEVERYIGSCLISSSARSSGAHKSVVGRKQEPLIRGKSRGCYGGQSYPGGGNEQCQVQYGPGGWAGAPLISMTSSPRRCNQRSSPSLLQQQQQQQHSCEQQQIPPHLHKSPLTRLAIHTQGAPLILAGRFHNRGKVHSVPNVVCPSGYVHGNVGTTGTMNVPAARCPQSKPQRMVEAPKKQQAKPECAPGKESAGTNIANIDSLSIASDESSGSNNSENSLPRIIKPRKRRKKDRKPLNNVAAPSEGVKQEEQQQQHQQQQQQQQQHQQHQQLEQPSVITLKQPYVPSCYEQRYETQQHIRSHRRPTIGREISYGCRAQPTGPSMQEIADVRQRYRHVEVKVLDDNRNVVVPVPVCTIPSKGYRHHHPGPRYLQEYGESCEDGAKEGLGTCQCRYCDPSGLIWDVDQNGYSPFLTPSSPSNEFCPGHFPHVPLFLSRPALGCQEQTVERLFDVDSPRGHQERDTVVLRRSWSDPTSYFSEEIAVPSKDVGVIGDRGQSEGGKRRTLWRGDTIGVPTSAGSNIPSLPATSKGLEVSTEIITSPNGHRDLEIKFYSPSPNARALEGEKGAFGEEVDVDEEDFSDIWSYHESKLQQDFRTLLQAEE